MRNRFPFYYEVKTLLILWIVLPQPQGQGNGGSTYLFQSHISPFLTNHESTIDGLNRSLSIRLKLIGRKISNRLLSSIRGIILGGGGEQGEGSYNDYTETTARQDQVGDNSRGTLNSILGWGITNVLSSSLQTSEIRRRRTQLKAVETEKETRLRKKREKLEKELANLKSRQEEEEEEEGSFSSDDEGTDDEEDGYLLR